MSNTPVPQPGVMPPASPSEIDLLALLRDGEHFAEKRGDYVYVINARSGRTIAVQQEVSPTPLVHVPMADGDLYIQPGITPQVLNSREILYNPLTVDLICQKIAEGGALTKICKEPGMPTYTTFCRWRRQNADIDKMLHEARKDRAETMRDEAMQAAEDADEDNLDTQKFKAEMKKWAAGVDDGKYSPKAKVDVTNVNPTQIVVHTGIDRSAPLPESPAVVVPATQIATTATDPLGGEA